jgi:hypothetical protein
MFPGSLYGSECGFFAGEIQFRFRDYGVQYLATPRQGQLAFVTTASRAQKYFAEFAYLCLTRPPVDSGPGEIVGSERCGEVVEVLWGLVGP